MATPANCWALHAQRVLTLVAFIQATPTKPPVNQIKNIKGID
jgi:hypothetical protein